ncbi:hypothetical protein [Streptomyces sp. NPDC059802]|uniref:hypothetical protein n=1 Tax=Streptomyces sp. NPDC059802 TaxID=3346952 RepID=UPI00365C34A2
MTPDDRPQPVGPTGHADMNLQKDRECPSAHDIAGTAGSPANWWREAVIYQVRAHPGLGAGDAVEWTEAPAGVLVFRRQGFVCTMNTSDEAVRIPAPGRLLLASSPVGPTNGSHGASFELDANATVWWTV